jgi:hypothetical protein
MAPPLLLSPTSPPTSQPARQHWSLRLRCRWRSWVDAAYAAGGVAGGDGAAAATTAVVPNQPANTGASAYAAGGVAGGDGAAAAVVPNQPADMPLTLPVA